MEDDESRALPCAQRPEQPSADLEEAEGVETPEQRGSSRRARHSKRSHSKRRGREQVRDGAADLVAAEGQGDSARLGDPPTESDDVEPDDVEPDIEASDELAELPVVAAEVVSLEVSEEPFRVSDDRVDPDGVDEEGSQSADTAPPRGRRGRGPRHRRRRSAGRKRGGVSEPGRIPDAAGETEPPVARPEALADVGSNPEEPQLTEPAAPADDVDDPEPVDEVRLDAARAEELSVGIPDEDIVVFAPRRDRSRGSRSRRGREGPAPAADAPSQAAVDDHDGAPAGGGSGAGTFVGDEFASSPARRRVGAARARIGSEERSAVGDEGAPGAAEEDGRESEQDGGPDEEPSEVGPSDGTTDLGEVSLEDRDRVDWSGSEDAPDSGSGTVAPIIDVPLSSGERSLPDHVLDDRHVVDWTEEDDKGPDPADEVVLLRDEEEDDDEFVGVPSNRRRRLVGAVAASVVVLVSLAILVGSGREGHRQSGAQEHHFVAPKGAPSSVQLPPSSGPGLSIGGTGPHATGAYTFVVPWSLSYAVMCSPRPGEPVRFELESGNQVVAVLSPGSPSMPGPAGVVVPSTTSTTALGGPVAQGVDGPIKAGTYWVAADVPQTCSWQLTAASEPGSSPSTSTTIP